MSGIRLPRIPDRTPVKLSIGLPPELHRAIADYAEFYAEAYGEAETVQDLIPAMLASFLESDRAFARRRGRHPKAGSGE